MEENDLNNASKPKRYDEEKESSKLHITDKSIAKINKKVNKKEYQNELARLRMRRYRERRRVKKRVENLISNFNYNVTDWPIIDSLGGNFLSASKPVRNIHDTQITDTSTLHVPHVSENNTSHIQIQQSSKNAENDLNDAIKTKKDIEEDEFTIVDILNKTISKIDKVHIKERQNELARLRMQRYRERRKYKKRFKNFISNSNYNVTDLPIIDSPGENVPSVLKPVINIHDSQIADTLTLHVPCVSEINSSHIQIQDSSKNAENDLNNASKRKRDDEGGESSESDIANKIIAISNTKVQRKDHQSELAMLHMLQCRELDRDKIRVENLISNSNYNVTDSPIEDSPGENVPCFKARMDETDEALLLLLLLHRRRRLKVKRCCWVKDLYKCRRQQGHFHSLIQEMRLSDEEVHFNYFRMSKQQMDKLLHLVGPSLEPRRTNWRNDCLSAAERLCLTIRFLATGDSYSSMSYAFRCAPSTVSVVIKATTQILWQKLKGTYMPPVTTRGWAAIAQQFHEKWNFPNCCGAIDGKHVAIKCPGNTSSEHFNYKETFSILFLALSDADYRFISVDVGTKGKDSDRSSFRESALGNAIINGKINFPFPSKPLGSEVELPHVLVANEAFPLHTNIMRPYPSCSLEHTKIIFNYRLKRARMVIENAFGVLCTRWRIFDRVLELSPDTVDYVILATTVLHNFLRTEAMTVNVTEDKYCPPLYVDSIKEDGESLQNGSWRKELSSNVNLKDPGRIASNNYSKDTALIREKFANYFVSPAGSLSSQDNATKINLS